MNIDDAKWELDAAERNLRGCGNQVHRTSREWLKAEAARTDNRMHSRLRGQYEENYQRRLKEDWEGARKAFDRARAQRDKAKERYEKALAEHDAK